MKNNSPSGPLQPHEFEGLKKLFVGDKDVRRAEPEPPRSIPTERIRIVVAMRQLSTAFSELANIWGSPECREILDALHNIEGFPYPFTKSFDEVEAEVHAWEKAVVESFIEKHEDRT